MLASFRYCYEIGKGRAVPDGNHRKIRQGFGTSKERRSNAIAAAIKVDIVNFDFDHRERGEQLVVLQLFARKRMTPGKGQASPAIATLIEADNVRFNLDYRTTY